MMSRFILRCWPLFAVIGLLFVILAVAYSKLEWGVAGAMLMGLGVRFAFQRRTQGADSTTPGPAS